MTADEDDQAASVIERLFEFDCDAGPDCTPQTTPFFVTKEHRRFIEFCNACRRDRYIGLCYGPPGVGKTLSAHQYAGWDHVNHWLEHGKDWHRDQMPAELLQQRTAIYTPAVTETPRTLEANLHRLTHALSSAIEQHLHPDRGVLWTRQFTELVVVDEADRLKTSGLEVVRDHHDRHGTAVILIGMPGIEKRLARYPQLYSRVGFVHHYRAMSTDEQAFVVAKHWPDLGLDDPDDFTTAEALATINRITSGNFRLTHRLVAQVRRILDINQLSTVTKEVVETARESLVIGI